MFSLLSSKITFSDIKNEVENVRSSRPFEIVPVGSDTNINIKPGYKGSNVLYDSYYFTNMLFDSFLQIGPGDRILLYGQNNLIENGIWSVQSVVSGFVNIQRPPDYAKNTPIRTGQCVLITEGLKSGKIIINNTPEYDSNQNKIISYNGTSPQNWVEYKSIFIDTLIPRDRVTLYTDCWYKGTSVSLGVGEYPYLSFIGIPVNTLSSLRIPPGFVVSLYTHHTFNVNETYPGRKVILTSDASCLTDVNFNDTTTSMKIAYTL
jgi:hypothetical protein